MSRITIEDLPAVQDLPPEELEQIFGAGPRRVRLGLEALESRELMAASVFSGLQPTPAQLDLQTNGHVLVTQNGAQTDGGGGVVNLFQGKNVAGQQVAYELLADNTLREFTSNETWIAIGTANQVASVGGSVLFTHNGSLSLATGVASSSLGATPLLADVQSLTTTGGQAVIQVGCLLTADVSASLDSSGVATLSFTNVNLDVGAFASGIVTTLQKFTKLQQVSDLATFLNKPLLPESWASSFTPLKLLQGMGYDVSSLQTFANAVTTINNINPSQSMTVQIGDFQAQASAGGALSYLNAAAPDLSGVTSYLNTLFAGVDGVTCGLGDSQQLLNLLDGANVNLFSYTLNANAPSITLDTHLATIPISPETGTTLELDLLGSVTVSGGATFGFTSAGLQTGDLAKGFCIESADLSATLSIGLAGTVNEACLVGYRLIAQLSGTVGAALQGSLSSDQINADSFGTYDTPLKLQFITKTMGPEQLLSEYANPKALEASAQMLGSALHDAAGNAFAAAQAKNAQLLNGVDKTAANIANALQGLYSQGAQDVAGELNSLNQKADDIAGALKGLYFSQVQDAAEQAKDIAQAMIDAGVKAGDTAQALYDKVTQDADAVANALTAAGIKAADLASDLPGQVLASIKSKVQNAEQAASDALNKATQDANSYGQKQTAIVQAALQNAQSQYQQGLGQLNSAYNNGTASLQNAYNAAVAPLKGQVAKAVQQVQNLTQAVQNAQANLNWAIPAWSSWVNQNIASEGKWLQGVLNNYQGQINSNQAALNSYAQSIAGYIDSLQVWANNALANIGFPPIGFGLSFGSVVKSAVNSAINTGKDVGQAVANGVQGVVQDISNVVNNAYHRVSAAAQQAANSIRSQFNALSADANQKLQNYGAAINNNVSTLQGWIAQAKRTYSTAVAGWETEAVNAIAGYKQALANAQNSLAGANANLTSLQQQLGAATSTAQAKLSQGLSELLRQYYQNLGALQATLQQAQNQAASQMASIQQQVAQRVAQANQADATEIANLKAEFPWLSL